MERREGDGGSSGDLPSGDGPVSPALRSVLSAMPTPALACVSGSHAIRAANSPAVSLLDREPAALRVLDLSTLTAAGTTVDGDSVDTAIDRARTADGDAGTVAVETEAVDGDESRQRLELTPRLSTVDGDEWLIVGVTDVTDRLRAESQLRSQLRVTEAIASTLPGALFECTAHGTLHRWNDQFAAETGY
ncbi:histidine kinase, partial [Halorubrum sp. SD626R]